MSSRRKFITGSIGAVAGALATSSSWAGETTVQPCATEVASLCGEWLVRHDPGDLGTQHNWYGVDVPGEGWRAVRVPHTWQVEPPLADFRGTAWYWRAFDLPGGGASANWRECAVRVEFEAVFHTATVWVNGHPAGEHVRKGYTAFTLYITKLLRWDRTNIIVVRVNNAFDQHMVPRGRSSDWAHDGGVFRPVQLLVTPKTFVERIDVEAVPDLAASEGKLTITAYVRNAGSRPWNGRASFRVFDEEPGLAVLNSSETSGLSIQAGAVQTALFHAALPHAKLWHFDHPNLYRIDFSITDECESHQFSTTFGVRKLEVKDGKFHLNGEHVRLMGVERMAGSNPEFGMAEPEEWIRHDHADMKLLNCIFTRVHWPQDQRVLDYCDRHGILMQAEVPAWGYDTFQGMGAGPDADIMQNGLEQLQEMVARDRNHPSVVVWGLW